MRVIRAVICSGLVISGVLGLGNVEDLLASMSLGAKIGQMVQIDIAVFMVPGTTIVNSTLLKSYIEEYQIGSILNSPFSGGAVDGVIGWTASEWRDVLHEMTTYSSALTESGVPIIYGIDSIHGATFVRGAALMPQALNMAATFDLDSAYLAGKITSKDTRAAGIPWIFAPVLGLGLQPLWARFPETFGEDPYLAAQMGAKIINGLQYNWNQDYASDDITNGYPRQTAACMKHFIAYSMPQDGHDRSPVQLPDRLLKQLYLPSFQAAINAGVLTAMESYQEVGGVPMVSSKDYLTTLLRKQMNFTGFIVTDYQEIENLHSWHKVSATQEEAVLLSMTETTIDQSMVPLDTTFYTTLLNLVQTGAVQESRIDDSVRRILQVKQQLGLLSQPIVNVDNTLTASVGLTSDWEASLNISRKSITLVKNNAKDTAFLLPLSTQAAQKVLVAGPTGNSSSAQLGGWAVHWQGPFDDSELVQRMSVYEGVVSVIGVDNVLFNAGPSVNAVDTSEVDFTLLDTQIAAADIIILCLGEGSYAEKPGDIDDLMLPAGQLQFASYLQTKAAQGPKKDVILVAIEGRPRLMPEIIANASAVLLAYQPGPLGGQAIAEVIYGTTVPSGRLPFTYPMQQANMIFPYHHKPSDMCTTPTGPHSVAYVECDVQFQFGDGLSYATFEYSNLIVTPDTVDEFGSVSVSINVKNTHATITADHVVMLFVTDIYRRVTPEMKLLKRFTRLPALQPGEQRTVPFELKADDWQYIGVDSRYVLESGSFAIGMHPSVDCRSSDNTTDWVISTQDTTSNAESMCRFISLNVSSDYHPVCDRACGLWSQGLCGTVVSTEDCRSTCIQQNWAWSYVDCLEGYYMETCASVDDMQCYDAMNIATPSSTDDCSSEGQYSAQFVGAIGAASGVGGIVLGAMLLYVALIMGMLDRSIQRALTQPLLSDYGKISGVVDDNNETENDELVVDRA